MSLKRMLACAAVVAVVALFLSAPSIPGWLIAVLGIAAIPLGIRAAVKQKRLERDIVRSLWRSARGVR
jgi:hypothetical protein